MKVLSENSYLSKISLWCIFNMLLLFPLRHHSFLKKHLIIETLFLYTEGKTEALETPFSKINFTH